MDALTFLAELKQTQLMFAQNLSAVNGFAERAAKWATKKARKGRNRSFSEVLDRFNGKFLEYQYGWKPLIHDLQDACVALTASSVEFVKGRASQVVQHNDSRSTVIDVAPAGAKRYRTETVIATHRVHGWAASEVKDGVPARFGFDPFKTGWEIVPYSFVIDWFIDVGSWIDTVSPFAPGRLLGSCVSIKSEITRSITLREEQDGQFHGAIKNVGAGNLGARTVVITRYQRYPREPSLPGWNPRLTPQRIINGLALAIAARTKVFKLLTRK